MNQRPVPAGVRIEPVDVASPEAWELVHALVTEAVHRRRGKPPPSDRVDGILRDPPGLGLAGPDDVLLVARDASGAAVGCGGLRILEPGIGEVKRMYVRPAARGRGIAAALLGAVEERARVLGLHELRLDTRSELVEALTLYSTRGYVEVEPYNDNEYAQHWFAKRLD